jgi:hypothetical protein
MNKKGHPQTLVASHPGNTNALKHGIHSPRVIEARAAEIEAELRGSFDLRPEYRLTAREVARNIAVLDATDDWLAEHGLTDRRGKLRPLVEQRVKFSRLLGYWLEKLSPELERQRIAAPEAEDAPPAMRKRSPERLAEFFQVALESGLVDQCPEIEAELVKRGWTPPQPKQAPVIPNEVGAGSGENENPREDGSEPDEGSASASSANQVGDANESQSTRSRDPELPPGTVLARVPGRPV